MHNFGPKCARNTPNEHTVIATTYPFGYMSTSRSLLEHFEQLQIDMSYYCFMDSVWVVAPYDCSKNVWKKKQMAYYSYLLYLMPKLLLIFSHSQTESSYDQLQCTPFVIAYRVDAGSIRPAYSQLAARPFYNLPIKNSFTLTDMLCCHEIHNATTIIN